MTADLSAPSAASDAFRRLHVPSRPFVMPNAWDVGSARILAGLGFPAIATTSSGFALSLGRRDYGVTRDETLAHCRALVAAVDVPVSADLENGFGTRPEDAAETIALAAATGLAGGSIEDSTGDAARPVHDMTLAIERTAAAAEAARSVPGGFVLTARAEAFLYGDDDLDALITRLQAFAAVGADVVYAPGLRDLESLATVCAAVDVPVNALVFGSLRREPLSAFGKAGAARVSTGGRLALHAYATLAGFAGVLADDPFDAADAVPGRAVDTIRRQLR